MRLWIFKAKLRSINKAYLKAYRSAISVLDLYLRLMLRKNLPKVDKDDDEKICELLNLILFLKKTSLQKRLAIIRPFYKDKLFKQIISFFYQIECIKLRQLDQLSQDHNLSSQNYQSNLEKNYRKSRIYGVFINLLPTCNTYSFIKTNLYKTRQILLDKIINFKLKRTDRVLKTIAKNIVGITSLLFIILIISVGFYEWSYFKTLGIPLRIVPLNVESLLLSAINWIPSMIVYGFISFAYFFLFLWFQEGLKIKDYVKNPTNKKVVFYTYAKYFLLFSAIASLTITDEDKAYGCYYTFLKFSFAWLIFTLFIFDNSIITTRIPNKSKYFIAFAPVYMFYLYFYGSASAYKDINKEQNATVYLKDNLVIKKITVLRNYSSGILIYNHDKSIEYIQGDNIIKIKFKNTDLTAKKKLIPK